MIHKEASYPVVLLFLLLVHILNGKADPLYTICSNTTITNSIFQFNLNKLLQSLPSKTSSSGNYYNTSIGEDSHNPVYVQALCRGDVNSTVCYNCIQSISQNIMKGCPNDADATIFYDLCQVRYSYKKFFSLMVYAGKYPSWSASKQTVLDPDMFPRILTALLKNLSDQAINDPSNRMFAIGEHRIEQNHTLYGLVQCTKDLNKDDCKTCLERAREDILSYHNTAGGIVLTQSCNTRYELYLFYQLSNQQSILTPNNDSNQNAGLIAIITSASILLLVGILAGSCCYFKCRRSGRNKDEEKRQHAILDDSVAPTIHLDKSIHGREKRDSRDQMNLMNFCTLEVATANFSDSNKLGKGGFGIVYKGILHGKEVAVKRLSSKSWQGLEEFKNEIVLLAGLQHRNLVRLLGGCLEDKEKLLIYEFMPNGSLDMFIFDPARRQQLDWSTTFNIIVGTARGLLYLHEDSRMKVIHRDLKPSNILLDSEMNAKISDFGMARIFGGNQNQANTKRVVGTHGYMAPEYAMEGLFSVKSDVYSFGVVLLEILSGKRCSTFYLTQHAQSLLTHAWQLWKEDQGLDFMEGSLVNSCTEQEVLRCMQIALLCVQRDEIDRPTMSDVLSSLESESIQLVEPTQPAFSVGRVPTESNHYLSSNFCSAKQITMSTMSGR